MLPDGLITGKTARMPGDMKQRPAAQVDLADGFLALWRRLRPDLPEPEREYRFHPTRKWRIDLCWPVAMLAVEIEGMAPGGGRHQRRTGFTRDAEKYREIVKAGYRLLRYTSDELRQRPVQIVEEVAAQLTTKGGT